MSESAGEYIGLHGQPLTPGRFGSALQAARETVPVSEAVESYDNPEVLRRFQEHLSHASLEFFYQQLQSGADLHEIIGDLHRVASVGWRLFDLGDLTEIQGGEFRTQQVSFGEVMPPLAKDVPALMDNFSVALSRLLESARPEDSNLIAAWAYTNLTAIHPFPDGNGRTGRALVNFVRYSISRRQGTDFVPLNFISASDRLTELSKRYLKTADQTYQTLEKVMYELGLYIPQADHEGARPTSRGRFSTILGEYYPEVVEGINRHLHSVRTVGDLQKYPQLKKLAGSLRPGPSHGHFQNPARPSCLG